MQDLARTTHISLPELSDLPAACPGGHRGGIRPFLQDQGRKAAQATAVPLTEDNMDSSKAPERL